jgi:hypothetical protein
LAMSATRIPRSVVEGRGPLLAFALLLALAVPWRHPAADDAAFSATVTVDATAENVAKARDLARTDGQRRALNAVVDKLVGGPGKTLKLNDNQITDLVANFEVANEKMSAVRYVADYTFHFRPAELTKALQSAGIAVSDTTASSPTPTLSSGGAKPIVVLPVYREDGLTVLWDDPNPWRQAWTQRPAGTGAQPLLVPLGDVSDLAAIDADKAEAGDTGALAAIAKKEGADEVLVMFAAQRASGSNQGLDITVRRYRTGQFVDAHFDSIDANPGEDEAALFSRAADTITADINGGWKNTKDNLAGQQGRVVVVAPITGLDDWIKLRDRLAGLPSVRKIDIKSLSRQEATVEIQYLGSMDQLKANLAAIKLDLQGGDPTWRLARSADKP